MPPRFFSEQPGGGHQPLDLGQAHAGVDPHPAVAPERLETAVEQHDPLVRIEQHERIGNALDRIDQMLMRGFRAQASFAEQVIARLEFSHGLIQRVGAFTHLLGQHHRMLERRVRVVATSDAGLDPLDQRAIDALQFVVVALQAGDLCLKLSGVQGTGLGQWQPR